MLIRQGTVFGGVGSQLVQDHCQWLSGLCGKLDFWTLNERAAFFGAESQLRAHELSERNAPPAAAAQQSVRIGQGVDAPVEYLEELICRFTVAPGLFRNRRYAGKYILHTMVELGDQQAFVVLSFSTFGQIDVNTSHALGATIIAKLNQTSSFNPPDFSTGENNPKLVDELMPPFLERADMFAAQPLHIVPMDASVPFFLSDL
jgi:hypothetical protein